MDWRREFFESVRSNHPDLGGVGFAHVANVGELHVDEPYELTDGLHIRKATQSEADTLSSLVDVIRPVIAMRLTRNPYETALRFKEAQQDTVSHITTDLTKDDWRYHVITFQGTNTKLEEFVDASVFTQCRLELGATVAAGPLDGGISILSGPHPIERVWREMAFTDDYLLNLGLNQLDDLRLVFQKFINLEDDPVGLRSAVNRMQQLDVIPKESPLRFLGNVSVLESLITHAPVSTDPYDSLTRQVRQKMLLVGHRSVIPIPYEVFEAGVGEGKIWTKLYDYRSAIAHGATPNFKGKLQCLKDPATALEFINCATVALMRQALEEPSLIADLRAC